MLINGVDQYAPISSSRDLLSRLAVVGMLLVALITYLCIGAACFTALEAQNEDRRWAEGKTALEDYVVGMLPNNTDNATIQEKAESLTKIIRRLANEANPYIFENRKDAWSFIGGLYVSVSTVTTIGYGNIFPVTGGGQAFLVLFALVGIPICFLFIAYLGALLASTVEYLFNFPLRNRSRSSVMFIVLVCSAGLVLAELVIFSIWIKYGLDKDMSYWDAFYFAFISFTTIGFGNHGFYNGDNANITKVLFTLLIVILCLAPLALYINLIVRDVLTVASPILEKIGQGVTDSEPPQDPEQEMISKTKEFRGEQYGAT